jgi:hypothetical protein
MGSCGSGDGLKDIERRFDAAMSEIYERAGHELGYWATRYLQMLRRLGGLKTARRLLAARTTSDGYARLREEGRLDLTVEAYVLRPEFQPLFTATELDQARARLAHYQRVMETEARNSEPPDPALVRLLATAATAPAYRRVDFRDQVAAFGMAAIPALRDWVAAGNSPGFACTVLEVIGRTSGADVARQALRRMRPDHPDWGTEIDAAIHRLETPQRSVPNPRQH